LPSKPGFLTALPTSPRSRLHQGTIDARMPVFSDAYLTATFEVCPWALSAVILL